MDPLQFAETGRLVLGRGCRAGIVGYLRRKGVAPSLASIMAARLHEDKLFAWISAVSDNPARVITSDPLPPDPAELLGRHRFRTLLDTIQALSDLVILESPPRQSVADAARSGGVSALDE